MELNGVKVAEAGSSVNSSTAVGYRLEEMIVKHLLASFSRPNDKTSKAAYELKYSTTAKFDLVIKLKVEKHQNAGIASAKNLKSFYLQGNNTKLYLVLKSHYQIDIKSSSVIYQSLSSEFLEIFLTTPEG